MGEYFDTNTIGQKLILNKSILYDQMDRLRSLLEGFKLCTPIDFAAFCHFGPLF